jgi:E3 ubiquitin-protein ligase UBR4
VATVNIAAYYCRRDKLTHSGESGGYKCKRGKSSSNVLDTAAAATNEDDSNSGSGDSNAAALSTAKPMIIYFGLINKAHSMCAAATTASSTSSSSSSSSGDSEAVQSVANWVAQRDSEEVLSLGSALLHHFERELVPAATAEAHIKACASITTTASAVVSAAAADESDLYLTDDTTAGDARTAVETVSEKFASLVQEGELMAACESA